MTTMKSDDVREILAKLEPALAGLARGQATLETRMSAVETTLIRVDERTKLAPTTGSLIGLVLGTNAGVIAVGALLAHFIH